MRIGRFDVKEILGVIHYRSKTKSWITKERKDHIVGIQISGKATHTFANDSFDICENSVYFLNRKDDYRVNVIEDTDAFSIHFTTYGEIDTDSFCVTVSNPYKFLSILQKAETAKISQNELMLRSMLYSFCAEMEKAKAKYYSKSDERIAFAKNYIDAHFREKSCLRDVSAKIGLSDRRLRTLFQNAYSVSPAKYVTRLKTELAKSLLSVGMLSVTEVSELCGFSDIYYFSKVFRKETGASPSKW